VRSSCPIDPFDQAENGLHLHPPESLAGVKDEVVAFAVSVRPGHAKTRASRFVQKRKFGQLACLFGLERSADQRSDLRFRWRELPDFFFIGLQ